VSPKSSSNEISHTSPAGCCAAVASGHGRPAETRAARSATRRLLPVPGSPQIKDNLPNGKRPGQSHSSALGATSHKRTIAGRSSGAGSSPGVQTGAASASSCSRSAVPPASSQFETSPFSGNSGRSKTLTSAATVASERATACPWSFPFLSLSGKMTTDRPRRGSPYSAFQFPAPPGAVVAISPSAASRSASFSPSTKNTGRAESAAVNSGNRYSTRRTPCKFLIQPPGLLGSGRRCRKSLGSNRTT